MGTSVNNSFDRRVICYGIRIVGMTQKRSYPITGLHRPLGLEELEAPRTYNRQMKVIRLLALCTGRLYPPGKIPGTHFYQRLSRPQGHNATGRIKSLKNSSDSIGNRTHDLPACSAVPQPTAPPRTRMTQQLRKNSYGH